MAGAATLTVRAPGRVNLIGEHTDYNDGFVMPVAIDRYTSVRATARSDRLLRASSSGFPPDVQIDLRAPLRHAAATDSAMPEWGRYLLAVVRALQDEGHELRGADLQIDSTVPAGAGLSSSAAFEVACAYTLLRLAGAPVELTSLSLCCQRAENVYVGARCGIMDQFIACHAKAGHALLLDCRTLDFQQLPLHFGTLEVCVVICNSMVRHTHAGGEYNQRRAQCEAGVQLLAAGRSTIRALRDVTLAELNAHAAQLDPLLLRRCRHVVSENERVQGAAAAIRCGDAAALGALMYASHASMRDDYEISCRELDLLVEIAQRIGGVYGSRMTGGGFGGCTVSLVRSDCVADFEQQVVREYRSATGLAPQLFICRASNGVGEPADV